MNDAIRDVTVTGHETLIEELELPDPDDRHVLAAAIYAQAEVIVTFNLKDFPIDALDPFGVASQHPDVFLTNLFDTNNKVVADAARAIAAASKTPPRTVAEIVACLDAGDPPTLARRLRTYFQVS